MPRPKKDNHPLSVRMDADVYNRLESYCETSGVPKTTAIERAVSLYIDNYDEMMTEISASERVKNQKKRF